MPRKRAGLPRPCPLCGRTDGTYQYVIFNHKNTMSRQAVICRIGHYDKNYYLKRQLEIIYHDKREKKKSEPVTHFSRELDTLLPTPNILKIKKPCGKIWHSFKVNSSLFRITHNGKTVNLTEYFDAFKEDEGWKTSYTIKRKPWMADLIKESGWQMEESLWIARRKVKEEYSFPSVLTKEDLLTENVKKWFARRKKYHMTP
jgi:hypothetical protein